MRDGLDADLEWITADGDTTTDRSAIFTDLFETARTGLASRGVADATVEEYLRPLEGRVRRWTTPARWKHRQVERRVAAGHSLREAIEGMQAAYLDRQAETLLTGSFLDWATTVEPPRRPSRQR